MMTSTMTKAEMLEAYENELTLKDKEIKKWKDAFEDQKKVTQLKEQAALRIKQESDNIIKKMQVDYGEKESALTSDMKNLVASSQRLVEENKRLSRGLFTFNDVIENAKGVMNAQYIMNIKMMSNIQNEYIETIEEDGK